MLWRLRNVELVSVERISAEILKKKKRLVQLFIPNA